MDEQKIGPRVREARNARKRTQKWLADEVGIKQSSVCLWETGRHAPSMENCVAVCLALHLNFEWLMTGRGSMDIALEPAAVSIAVPVSQSEEHEELIRLFDLLPKTKRQLLLQFIKDWANAK